MSNNAPDYNENLAFPPRHDETAYELKLKVSKLEKQLKIAKKGLTELKNYGDCNLDCEIAAKCLKQIKELDK
jgi:hypothetical protein